jgi:hypothetical protein
VSRQVQFQTEQAATTSSSRPNVRTRSLSSEDAHRLRSPAALRRLKQPQEVLVPTDFLLQLSSTGPRNVSDTVVAPKPFTGKAGQDAENWLEYLERYCAFRKLDVNNKRELFRILLQEGASDWLVTLPQADTMTYDELVVAFKANYFKSPELRWREAGEIWNQAQKPDERVDDFVTRIRRASRRLNFPPGVLHFAIINELRAPLRLHVVQQGVKTLEDTLRAARIAEAAATSTSDPLSIMMIEALKSSTQASEKQAAEIKQLTAKVATLTTSPVEYSEPAVLAVTPPPATAATPMRGQRPRMNTPQNLQRANYAQQANSRQNAGPRSFTRPQDQMQGTPCTRCGIQHRAGTCRADGHLCRACNRPNHFARCCRSARPSRD